MMCARSDADDTGMIGVEVFDVSGGEIDCSGAGIDDELGVDVTDGTDSGCLTRERVTASQASAVIVDSMSESDGSSANVNIFPTIDNGMLKLPD